MTLLLLHCYNTATDTMVTTTVTAATTTNSTSIYHAVQMYCQNHWFVKNCFVISLGANYVTKCCSRYLLILLHYSLAYLGV